MKRMMPRKLALMKPPSGHVETVKGSKLTERNRGNESPVEGISVRPLHRPADRDDDLVRNAWHIRKTPRRDALEDRRNRAL